MNKKIFVNSIFFYFITLSAVLFAPPKQNNLTFFLPINLSMSEGQKLYLKIEIPENFRNISESDVHMQEFIPIDDTDPSNWSEIITLQKYKGSNISAIELINSVKNNIFFLADNVELLQEEIKECNTHKIALFAVKYTIKNKSEVLFAKFFSGPSYCSGFQYSVALNDRINETQVRDKIRSFAQTRTNLIKF